MRLVLDLGSGIDITGVRFDVTPVDCTSGLPLTGGTPVVVEKALEEIELPGGIPDFEGRPLDASSEHVFADLFVTVEEGCFDVTATPITTGSPCMAAHALNVRVEAGKTTEVFLLNQCEGKSPGALDVVSALNRPPVIKDVSFDKSKFTATCEPQQVCATASDPDGDLTAASPQRRHHLCECAQRPR